MAIRFVDFVPDIQVNVWQRIKKATDPHKLVQEANRWIKKAKVKVINVETLVVPNPNLENYQSLPATKTAHGTAIYIQIIRVWYDDGTI